MVNAGDTEYLSNRLYYSGFGGWLCQQAVNELGSEGGG